MKKHLLRPPGRRRTEQVELVNHSSLRACATMAYEGTVERSCTKALLDGGGTIEEGPMSEETGGACVRQPTPGREQHPVPLVSKATPPCTPAFHAPRERIAQLLNQGMHRSITIVTAPEGYGKTTALADWLAHAKDAGCGTAWFSADEADADPSRFWTNFRYALKTSLPMTHRDRNGWDDASAWTEECDRGQEELLHLANELSLAANAGPPIAIVLEGFDWLEGTTTLPTLLSFISALSPNVHLFLSSRIAYTRHDFPRAPLPGMPVAVTAHELSYTEEECRQVVEAWLGDTLGDAERSVLYEKTGGWPLGVTTALKEIATGGNPTTCLNALSGMSEPFDSFFEHEVFETVDEDVRRFMVRTAMLDEICPRLCDYMLDCGGSAAIINDLRKHNLFLEPKDHRREWFTYQRLFAEWLKGKMLELPPNEARQLNSRAAHWHLRHDMPLAAAKHQILAVECSDIVNLVRAACPSQPSGTLNLVMRHRTLLPDLDKLPWDFCLLAAWAYLMSADLESTRAWAERTKRQAAAAGEEPPGLTLSLKVIEAKSTCLESRFDDGIRMASAVLPSVDNASYMPLRIMLLNCSAESLDQQGDLAAGFEHHRKMTAVTEGYPFAYMASINRYEIAYSHFLQGHLHKASEVCRALVASCPADYPVSGAARTLAALVKVVVGERTPSTHEQLESARMLLTPYRNTDMYLDWAIAFAWSHVAAGDAEQGDLALLEPIELLESQPLTVPRGIAPMPFLNRAIINLIRGKPGVSEAVYEEFKLLGISDTAYSRIGWQLVRMRIDSLDGVDMNVEALEELRRQADGFGFGGLALDIEIEMAKARFSQGKRALAFRCFHDAIVRAIPDQPIAPFSLRTRELGPLFSAYLEAATPDHLQRAFMRKVLRSAPVDRKEQVILTTPFTHAEVDLTSREREILKLAAIGYSRIEMAEELCITSSTVKSHLSHLYGKFEVKRYPDLMARAIDLGFV